MMRRSLLRPLLAAAALGAALGCAETSPSLPPPSQVLLMLDRESALLRLYPVEQLESGTTIGLAGGTRPTAVAARDTTAVVILGGQNQVAVVDLRRETVVRRIDLPAGAGGVGITMLDDSIAYVANAALNSITRVNFRTGTTGTAPVGRFPQAIMPVRGRLFVLNGNLGPCEEADSVAPPVPVGSLCALGPSWLTVLDPVAIAPGSELARSGDSIPLLGPGNARFADVAADGLLYVVNRGGDASGEGRLSIVDPIAQTEVGNFGGLGLYPGPIAADSSDRLFVSSTTRGLGVFDLRSRAVRDDAPGTQLGRVTAVETDAGGRVFVLDEADCDGGGSRLRVLRSDLQQVDTVQIPGCPTSLDLLNMPPEEPDEPEEQ